jgi:hypothetical protein
VYCLIEEEVNVILLFQRKEQNKRLQIKQMNGSKAAKAAKAANIEGIIWW